MNKLIPFWQKLTYVSIALLNFYFCIGPIFAKEPTLAETKVQLNALNDKINQLRKNLAIVHDKQGLLNHELRVTENEIHNSNNNLKLIQKDITQNQIKVNELNVEVKHLNQQFIQQQDLLKRHITTRYQIGEYQPLKWIINQKKPNRISRILTLYQYLIKSRQVIIQEIKSSKNNLIVHQNLLQAELDKQTQLKNSIVQQEQALIQRKSYHQEIISTLSKQIKEKQNSLNKYEQNKNNLTVLLKNLATQSIIKPKQPFYLLRKKLPPPLKVDKNNVQKMNQGVTFFAALGTPVTAVYPGKVVFSDWLNGYGLLIIIDHGQGYMTLYAHNLTLFKQKGSSVSQNEQIAAVGHSGVLKQNGLYFEIRHRGKAIPPFEWLS